MQEVPKVLLASNHCSLSLYFLHILKNYQSLFTDITGSHDGCVRIWDWTNSQCVSEVRKAGAFPKVTKVLFNAQGNKVRVQISFNF